METALKASTGAWGQCLTHSQEHQCCGGRSARTLVTEKGSVHVRSQGVPLQVGPEHLQVKTDRCYFPNWVSGWGEGESKVRGHRAPDADVPRGQESRDQVKSQVLPCPQSQRAPEGRGAFLRVSAASVGWFGASHQGSQGPQPHEWLVRNRTARGACSGVFPENPTCPHCPHVALPFSTGTFQHWEHTASFTRSSYKK